MIDIILTLDYEIFGNGTGDVKKHIIQPTNRLLEICDKYNAKLTIMFEIGEYWAFKKAESDGKLENLGYCPAGLMERQIKDAIKRGHDVQLHLHPQWIGAKYENGNWNLNLDYWRLPKLPNGLGTKDDIFSITGALHKGKRDLEKFLKPVNPEYECIGFRAGGWCIQPSNSIIKAFKEVGIISDTSVFRGGYIDNGHAFCDFRNSPPNQSVWWTSDRDVCEIGDPQQGILEIPIYAEIGNIFNLLSTNRIITYLKYSNQENVNFNKKQELLKNRVLNLTKTLQKLCTLQTGVPIKFDFCKLSGKQMQYMLKKAIKKLPPNMPVVLIGHSKGFYNVRNFDYFLKHASELAKSNVLMFNTYREVIKHLLVDDVGDIK